MRTVTNNEQSMPTAARTSRIIREHWSLCIAMSTLSAGQNKTHLCFSRRLKTTPGTGSTSFRASGGYTLENDWTSGQNRPPFATKSTSPYRRPLRNWKMYAGCLLCRNRSSYNNRSSRLVRLATWIRWLKSSQLQEPRPRPKARRPLHKSSNKFLHVRKRPLYERSALRRQSKRPTSPKTQGARHLFVLQAVSGRAGARLTPPSSELRRLTIVLCFWTKILTHTCGP